ncbi:MAG: TIGR03564 family F420-dependent LLM class oxidoreductase [Tepidiformaceae bacterium]
MRIGMQIGPKIGAQGTEDLVSRYREIEEAGFDTAWTGNHLTHDAMTILALAGTVTERIELGSSVVPTYPRHPMVMAQQALTTSAITGGRFTLGLGLSHKFIVEDWQGLKWATPIHHLREYLTVLNGLLDGEQVVHEGEEYQVSLNTAPFTQLDVPDAPRPQVVIAALGPGMLKVTGELADGTNCWMCGQGYLESTLVPTINKAAESAGRPAPRVIAGFPICVTNKVEEAKIQCAKTWEVYGQIYSYRQVLKREGASGPADLLIAGDEDSVAKQIEGLAKIGVTELNAHVLGIPEDPGALDRTTALLGGLSK